MSLVGLDLVWLGWFELGLKECHYRGRKGQNATIFFIKTDEMQISLGLWAVLSIPCIFSNIFYHQRAGDLRITQQAKIQ